MPALLQNTTTKQKIGMGIAAVAVLLVAIMLMKVASSPSYSTVATGVDPAQTDKMTAALDTKGIKWKLQNNGTAIAVDSGQVAQARVALAASGIRATARSASRCSTSRSSAPATFSSR